MVLSLAMAEWSFNIQKQLFLDYQNIFYSIYPPNAFYLHCMQWILTAEYFSGMATIRLIAYLHKHQCKLSTLTTNKNLHANKPITRTTEKSWPSPELLSFLLTAYMLLVTSVIQPCFYLYSLQLRLVNLSELYFSLPVHCT